MELPAEPQHRTEDCTCAKDFLRFPENKLIEVYETGCIPCFTIGKRQDGSLATAFRSIGLDMESQRQEDNHYVALSHVWSEGMGNQKSNALPLCQLLSAQHWANMAYEAMAKEDADPPSAKPGGDPPSSNQMKIHRDNKLRYVNIWIDTMCCPATPGYGKNLCLSMMPRIYSYAQAVLVKARALEAAGIQVYCNDTSKGVVDIGARIFLSPWMQRMWTLQESVLAGIVHDSKANNRFCFAFSDGLLSLMSLVKLLINQSPGCEATFSMELVGKFAQLTPAQWRLDKSDAESPGGRLLFWFLEILAGAVEYRGLGVPSDEIICLETLLGLGISGTHGPVTLLSNGQDTPEQAMCKLWRVIEAQNNGIPDRIIFSPLPRIRLPGFRWAPRTLVQHGKYSPRFVSGDQGNITERGLLVRFKGARLRLLSGPAAPTKSLLRNSIANGGEISEEDPEVSTSELIMVQIPAGSYDWYAMQIPESMNIHGHHFGSESEANPPSMPDIHGLVAAGSAAILFMELAAGPGLVVNLTHDSERRDDGVVYAHTEANVSLERLAPSSCIIVGSARECLKKLHAAMELEVAERPGSSIVELWRDEETVERLFVEAATRMFESSTELRESAFVEELAQKASATK